MFSNDSILNGLCFRFPLFLPTSLEAIAAPAVKSKDTALCRSKSNLAEAAATAKELLNNVLAFGSIFPGEGLKFLVLWTSEVELSELWLEFRLSALSRFLIEKSSGPESSSESPPTTSIMHSSLSFSGSESERIPAFRCWARYSCLRASRSTAMPFALNFRAWRSRALASFFLRRALLKTSKLVGVKFHTINEKSFGLFDESHIMYCLLLKNIYLSLALSSLGGIGSPEQVWGWALCAGRPGPFFVCSFFLHFARRFWNQTYYNTKIHTNYYYYLNSKHKLY